MPHLNTLKQKIITTEQVLSLVQQWKIAGEVIAFTNGCFDLLHRGHLEYLAQAADNGDKLIVGVNSDQSVKMLCKGSQRPFQEEYARALLIAAMNFVDAVVIFHESTPYELIGAIVPNVLIKGGDYDATITDPADKKYIIGSDIVKKNGGRVSIIPFVEGYSSSSIEQKIKHCLNQN